VIPRYLVTGANGHLGRRLIKQLLVDCEIEALVRSERARTVLLQAVGDSENLRVTIGDPADPGTIAPLASRCAAVVHLIGTIRESAENRYIDSHERPARALVSAVRGNPRTQIIYVSILGADAESRSRCLQARARVEALFCDADPAATIIRVPMVLGERDRASFALAKRAHSKRILVFRAGSLEQPIYAGDVITALANTLAEPRVANRIYELAGPKSLSRRELITRAASLLHNQVAVVSLPLAFGLGLAAVLEFVSKEPALTRDFLHVLDHDDDIDPLPAATALGVALTPLDEILKRCVVGRLR